MNFLVDAQLPRRVCAVLAQHGHNAIHTHEIYGGPIFRCFTLHEMRYTYPVDRMVVWSLDRIEGAFYAPTQG